MSNRITYDLRLKKPPASRKSTKGEAAELAELFHRNGHVRRQNAERLATDGYMGYKKGDEVRLTAGDRQEVKHIQALLKRAGFRSGRPFAKGRQYRVPIYGRAEVRRFLELIGAGLSAKS